VQPIKHRHGLRITGVLVRHRGTTRDRRDISPITRLGCEGTMPVVSEIAKRAAANVVASTAGGTVGPVVTALMVTAAAVTGKPELIALSVPTGAFADAMTEQGILLATKTLQTPAEQVERFANAVADESGQDTEDFISDHVDTPAKRQLLGHAVDAATSARSDWKIRILARAFVEGAKDGDLVDETEMFIRATRTIEPAHARFLAAASTLFGGTRMYAQTHEVLKVDPGIGPAGAMLWRHLRDVGLVDEMDTSATTGHRGNGFRVTDLGYAVGEWLTKLGQVEGAEVPQTNASGG
jgi:hypothetical protein